MIRNGRGFKFQLSDQCDAFFNGKTAIRAIGVTVSIYLDNAPPPQNRERLSAPPLYVMLTYFTQPTGRPNFDWQWSTRLARFQLQASPLQWLP